MTYGESNWSLFGIVGENERENFVVREFMPSAQAINDFVEFSLKMLTVDAAVCI
jgi:hypothetical protein